METSRKYKVLIIEDSRMSIVSLKNILNTDYSVIVAKNGQTGIEVAKTVMPDVIILDILMPDMDGYEIIAELKKTEKTRNIPVIFITVLSGEEDEEKGLTLGGADYITKPFSAAVIKLRVQNQIRMLEYIRTIEKLGLTDQLTELPNRRSFDERLNIEWKRAKREKMPLSLLIIDIDYFKKYNDTYGHLQGDVALKEIAGVLEKAFKRPGDFAARWGGEEFIALLPNTDSEGAVSIAEHVCKEIEATEIPLKASSVGSVTHLTVSIGVNTKIPDETDTESIDEFLKCADNALYAAKVAGRNKVRKHTEPEVKTKSEANTEELI